MGSIEVDLLHRFIEWGFEDPWNWVLVLGVLLVLWFAVKGR
ncbi:MAG: hypothetical protein ACE5H5_00330 [Nitrospinota bacterium]